jgi:hypothetical protein
MRGGAVQQTKPKRGPGRGRVAVPVTRSPLPDPLWTHPRGARLQAGRRVARSLVQRARRRRSRSRRGGRAGRRRGSHRPSISSAGTRGAATRSAAITATVATAACVAAAASVVMVATATRSGPTTTLPAAPGFRFPLRNYYTSNQRRQNDCHTQNSIADHHVAPC